LRQKALGAFVAVCIIWGTTYLGIRVSLETMPPFLMAGLRWTLAGTVFALGLAWAGRPLPALRFWGPVAVMSFLLLVIGNGAVVWAEQFVTSGLTAVVIATTPFWMIGAEALMQGEGVTGRSLAGLAVGFSGIVMLVWPELTNGGEGGAAFVAGIIALQIACAAWAVGSSWSKRHTHHQDVFATTALQMVLAGAMLLAIGTALGEWKNLHFSTRSTTAFIYLSTVGAIGGFGAYAYALKHLPVALVSLYAYINPIIAVVLGIVLLGEPFTIRMAVAAAIVLAGVAMVRSRTAAPRPMRTESAPGTARMNESQ
jgi:drug/metabolite transporter (DMT)-like permease